MELYIQVFFSGETSPNIYCELTLFRHGLTEEKRRERSSVAILGFRKLPSQIWYWKRKEVNELTMWNPLVIIRCKLVKICWRLGEGSMGTKRAVRLTCLYARLKYSECITLSRYFQVIQKIIYFWLCSFLGSWIQLQCVCMCECACFPTSPTLLTHQLGILQSNSILILYPEGVSDSI